MISYDVIIKDYLNSKKLYDVFLLDFSRAFDKVSHRLLRYILRSLRVAGYALG